MKQGIVSRGAAVALLALVLAVEALAGTPARGAALADEPAELRASSLADLVTRAIDAYKTDDGNWFYEESANGSAATLVAYIGASKTPITPATADGLPVTSVVAKPATGAPALTAIDLSKVAGTLESLQVYGCELASLDASGCAKLAHLDVRENALATLKVPASLETLMCSGNRLSALDVSKCAALEKLYCDRNVLYSLDVSKCPGLYYLDCADNRLTSLKCGANLDLNDVFCSGNYLSEDLKALAGRYGADEGVVLPQNSGAPPLLAQSVTASGKTVAMGKTVSLGAKASAGGRLSYKSSNEKVAKVSATGVVTPVSKGSASVTITAGATGNYGKATKTVKVTVAQGTQSLAFKAQSKTVKLANVKKRAQTFAIAKATGARTKVTYAITGDAKAKKRLAIDKATGKVTVKAGTPKGKYIATVKASAAKTGNWKAASKSAKVTVTVA